MKKITALFMAVLLSAFLAIPSAAAATGTIQWTGAGVTFEETDMKKDKEIQLSATLQIDPASFDAFDSCTLMLSYDNQLIDLAGNSANSIYTEELDYTVISEKTTYGYKATILNEEAVAPTENGFCFTLLLDMKVVDAEALIKAKGAKVELALFESDMKIMKDDVVFSYKDNAEEDSEIEMHVQLSPATITVNITTQTYKITYETNGSTAIEADEIKSGTPKALPKATRAGYTFAGWHTDAALTQKAADPYTATGNITLFAKWIKNENNDKNYTITYEANGGTKVAAKEVTAGTSAALPKITKEGYKLEGWYTDTALTNRAADPYIPTADITLYAKWTADTAPATYIIKYETNGGSIIVDATVQAGKSITLPTPVKSGYTFAGWYTEAALKNKISGTTYIPTANATLYAKWTANSSGNSVPKTGRNNAMPILIGVLGVLVLCGAAVVFLQSRRMNHDK